MTAQPLVAKQVGMSMDEFMRLTDKEGPFELIDGERIALMPAGFEHSAIIRLLLRLLYTLEETAGIACYPEQPFVLSHRPNWVSGSRIPDISVFRAERIADYVEQFASKIKQPIAIVPDLCIEILSPTDDLSELEAKVVLYLRDGVRVVWLFNADTYTVSVYTLGDDEVATLGIEATLEGGDVIPAFSVRVGNLFGK